MSTSLKMRDSDYAALKSQSNTVQSIEEIREASWQATIAALIARRKAEAK